MILFSQSLIGNITIEILRNKFSCFLLPILFLSTFLPSRPSSIITSLHILFRNIGHFPNKPQIQIIALNIEHPFHLLIPALPLTKPAIIGLINLLWIHRLIAIFVNILNNSSINPPRPTSNVFWNNLLLRWLCRFWSFFRIERWVFPWALFGWLLGWVDCVEFVEGYAVWVPF